MIKIFSGKSSSATQYGKLNPGAKIGVTEKIEFSNRKNILHMKQFY